MAEFRCIKFACTMPPVYCVARHTARHKTGGTMRGKVPTRFMACASCEQGAELLRSLEASGELSAMLEQIASFGQRSAQKKLVTPAAAPVAPPPPPAVGVAPLSPPRVRGLSIYPCRKLLAQRAAA